MDKLECDIARLKLNKLRKIFQKCTFMETEETADKVCQYSRTKFTRLVAKVYKCDKEALHVKHKS